MNKTEYCRKSYYSIFDKYKEIKPTDFQWYIDNNEMSFDDAVSFVEQHDVFELGFEAPYEIHVHFNGISFYVECGACIMKNPCTPNKYDLDFNICVYPFRNLLPEEYTEAGMKDYDKTVRLLAEEVKKEGYYLADGDYSPEFDDYDGYDCKYYDKTYSSIQDAIAHIKYFFDEAFDRMDGKSILFEKMQDTINKPTRKLLTKGYSNNLKFSEVADEQIKRSYSYAQITTKCCICGSTLLPRYSNNPFPVRLHGRCCNDCNYSIVLSARLSNHDFRGDYQFADYLNSLCYGELVDDFEVERPHIGYIPNQYILDVVGIQ